MTEPTSELTTEITEINEVLEFWFGAPGETSERTPREEWFQSSPELDAEIRSRFLRLYERAAKGDLDDWKSSARGCLALLILLDQFSRNLFREGPQAFAADSHALLIAHHAVAEGFDQQLQPVERWFIYLPFEHSEDREQQRRSVELFRALPHSPGRENVIDFAERHRRVIDRFGRFPHRNTDLGRTSTPEELEFLQTPDAPF